MSSCSARRRPARRRPHEEVSIEEIAEAAGVSKGLLYHYFPTKKDFIVAAIERDRDSSPSCSAPTRAWTGRQLDASLDAFLDYVEEHATAYATIFRGGGGDPEIGAALDAGRAEQMETLIEALGGWEALARQHRALPPSKPPSRAGCSSSRARCCAGSSTAASSARADARPAALGPGRLAASGGYGE